MNLEFRVLERDVAGGFVAHDCHYADGYFRTLSSIRPERSFCPPLGSPGDAKSLEDYKLRLRDCRPMIITLNASRINDLWSSVSLNFPGDVSFEGLKVPEQICRDLPRVQHLAIDGFLRFSSEMQNYRSCKARLDLLKPLVQSNEALFRLATLLTQASLDNIFLIINDHFSHPDFGYNVTHHPFSTLYLRSRPLSIRMCRLFKLICVENGQTIGYIKGERVYKLEKGELEAGIAIKSQIQDAVSPFFDSLSEAIAFSWKEKTPICPVS